MKKILSVIEYFNKEEIILWSSSVIGIIVSYYIFDGSNMIRLTAPLIGVTSILLNANERRTLRGFEITDRELVAKCVSEGKVFESLPYHNVVFSLSIFMHADFAKNA